MGNKLRLINVLKRCNGFIDNSENWEEELTEFGTLLVLYPHNSLSNLQVHFLVNGTVEIHRFEDHQVVERYGKEEALSIFKDLDKWSWSSVDVVHFTRLVLNWASISLSSLSIGGVK